MIKKIKELFKEWQRVLIELFMMSIIAAALVALFVLLFSNNAHCQPNNKDWVYLDSTFRAMEARKGGGSCDFKNRVFNITQNVNGPRTTGDVKIFTIDNLIIKGAGLMMVEKTQSDAGVQTNRTIIMHSCNIWNADVGMIIQGSHRSSFEEVCFYSCRKGASFEFCLEGKALNLQEHQCRDTGVYIGWCRSLPGANNSNSQSNNFCVNGLRSFGRGTEIGFIFDGVSGCTVNSLTNEGGGCQTFLKVTAKGSNHMKDFTATGFHVEVDNLQQQYVIQAEADGNSTFDFSNFYCQIPCVLVDGSGSGLIRISNIFYQVNATDQKIVHCVMFGSSCPSDGSIIWELTHCLSLSTHRSYYDPYYWIIDDNHCMPKPFSAGQQTINQTSSRLKENPDIRN